MPKARTTKQQLNDPVRIAKSHTLAFAYLVNRPVSTVPVMFGVGTRVLPQSPAHFGFRPECLAPWQSQAVCLLALMSMVSRPTLNPTSLNPKPRSFATVLCFRLPHEFVLPQCRAFSGLVGCLVEWFLGIYGTLSPKPYSVWGLLYTLA